jgi:GTPase SAR1 family protein
MNVNVTLMGLFGRIAALLPDPSPAQERNLRRLEELRQRLATERFQLAVLGQFKRGKSTLLNALLGVPVLPTAVVPLTAIPTFIKGGETPRLEAIYLSGARKDTAGARAEDLTDLLASLVTENGNPNNALGVDYVELSLPAPLLSQGVVLIDTPGVGSTFRHNTERAEAVLPECDAALFVVSPDPPITEVEISYLRRALGSVSRLVVVLNKIDTVEGQDRATSGAFLRQTLTEKIATPEAVAVFEVSARDALKAKTAGDGAAFGLSGLPALEACLTGLLVRDKHPALEDAVGRKAAEIAEDLLMETELRLRALRLPMEELTRAISLFDEAMSRLDHERRMIQDGLLGDRRRLLQKIETDADELRQRARAALQSVVERALAQAGDADAARGVVLSGVPALFDEELRRAAVSFQDGLHELLTGYRLRVEGLVGLVRKTAADLMNAPYRSLDADIQLEFRHEPYWVLSAQRETLAPVGPGMLDRFLPTSVRRRRARGRLDAELDAIVRRNVENLRWATRQNTEDAFRQIAAALDEMMARCVEDTRAAMTLARDQRLAKSDQVESQARAVEHAVAGLLEISTSLRDLVGRVSARAPA